MPVTSSQPSKYSTWGIQSSSAAADYQIDGLTKCRHIPLKIQNIIRLSPEILPRIAGIDNMQQCVQLSRPLTEEKEEDAFQRFICQPDFNLPTAWINLAKENKPGMQICRYTL
jgi:hypothetical protein